MSAESEAETMEKTVYKSVDEMPILMSAEDIAATGICGKNKAYDLFIQFFHLVYSLFVFT